MTRQVELIYDADCPNISAARKQLLSAHRQLGLEPVWVEWDRTHSDSPDYVQGYGSPTILVNGQDVEGTTEQTVDGCCRLYYESGRLYGVPSLNAVVSALREPCEYAE